MDEHFDIVAKIMRGFYEAQIRHDMNYDVWPNEPEDDDDWPEHEEPEPEEEE